MQPIYLVGSVDNYDSLNNYCGEVAHATELHRIYPHSFPSSPERLAEVMSDLFDLSREDVDVETQGDTNANSLVERAELIIDRTHFSNNLPGNPIGVNTQPIRVWGTISYRDNQGAIVRPILIEHFR